MLLEIILVFLFMLVFDTIGTLIGVAQPAGLLKDGKLPRYPKTPTTQHAVRRRKRKGKAGSSSD
mgnify:CR=1 FL=1